MLRKYQLEDLERWIQSGYRCAWYWDPGLGKTYTGSFVVKRLLKHKKVKKVFIGGPKIALSTWYGFLTQVMGIPESMIFDYNNAKHERAGYKDQPIIMCNYEKLPQSKFNKRKTKKKKVELTQDEEGNLQVKISNKKIVTRKDRYFPEDIDLWLLDESHLLQNYRGNGYNFFKDRIKPTDKVLPMSGTPIPNRHPSCYTQVDLIKPGVLGHNITAFRNNFLVCVNKKFSLYSVHPERMAELEDIVASIACFREADQHLDLPEHTSMELVYDPGSDLKRFINKLLRSGIIPDSAELFQNKNVSFIMGQQALSGYIDMKVTSQTAKKVHNITKEFDWNYPGGKYDIFKQLMNTLGDRKILVWVHFTETSRRLQEALVKEGYKVDRFSSDDKKDLEKRIKAFTEGDVQILISHPQIIGISVNYFTGINYMCFYELTWSWSLYEQAITRIHRSGQTHPTFCYHLVGHMLEKTQLQALRDKEDVNARVSALSYKQLE